MQLRFMDIDRPILTLEPRSDLEIPRRGEEVVIEDVVTGVTMIWGVVQVQRYYRMTADGLRLDEVQAQVRAIEPSRMMPNLLEVG